MENNNTVTLDSGTDTTVEPNEHVIKIRELNDAFRRSLTNGRVLTTTGVTALGSMALLKIVTCVRVFDNFSEANDPYGEHDFGSFDFDAGRHHGETVTIFFKIDYYDSDCHQGSEDPSDPAKTTRVMTIYLASEH